MTTHAWTDTAYTESAHARIPADVYWFGQILSDKKRKLKVSDQLPSGHWIKTYCGGTFVRATGEAPDLKGLAKLAGAEASLKNYLVKAPSGSGPKALEGRSLFDAALRLKNGTDPAASKGEAKGLERAMRYYMLATYSLIDTLAVQKAEASLVNNYVAAMLVSHEGKILSVGMNVGSFMHAEVSMLLSYFINNPAEQKLPEKSMVFSTLTPCMQCTKFLMESRAGSTLMYFGQMDKGDFGNIGALDVKAFKAEVEKDKSREYDTSYLTGMAEGEAMTLPGLFGKAPKVYNVNQGEINDVVKLIAELKERKRPAYEALTNIDFRVKGKDDAPGKISNTAGQLKKKPEAVKVFSESTTTLSAKGKIAEHKAKGASADDIAFRAIQKDVLDYLTRSLEQIQFYA